jgi:hypothetical protein
MSVSIVFIQNQSNKIEIFAQYIEVPSTSSKKNTRTCNENFCDPVSRTTWSAFGTSEETSVSGGVIAICVVFQKK